MNDEIKILYDEKKVIVAPQVLEKIKYLTRGEKNFSDINNQLDLEMDINLFYDKINRIVSKSTIDINSLPKSENEINYNTDLMDTLSQKYNELLPEEKRKDFLCNDLSNVDENMLNNLLDVIYKINIEEKNYYLVYNLINAKNDCMENLKYFVDENTILQFKEEYDKAIQEKNTKKMSDMLNYCQNAILIEWEKYIVGMDTMTDEKFSFVGHSTMSTKFDKDYLSKYVSCSLFNQDITDTYRSSYGFILAPKNIIGAKSQDMYVNNYAEDDDMTLNYSVIKKIDHPQRLLDECMNLKQDNLNQGKNQNVYNEVVINGFEPIGIFCFTDGSKSLNYDYNCAKQLQESFPDLKIYSYDLMKRKQGLELDEMKLNLINTLISKNTSIPYKIDKDRLSSYDYFFDEYEKLKQNGQYDESSIELIFQNNERLLSIFENKPDKLFNGMYDEKQIKYVLGKNLNYNIDYILSGKAKAFVLNKLKALAPYKDRLNSMYDGLGEFVDLVSRIEVTNEMMEEINKNDTINFYGISKHLASKLLISINYREEKETENLSIVQIKYNELLIEFQEKTKNEELYEYFSSINENKHYANMIKDDYNKTISDIKTIESKENEIQNELNNIILKIDELNQKKTMIMNSTYDKNKSDINYEKIIIEISSNLEELSKHPFLNRKKIIEEKSKLVIFENKVESQKKEFELNKNSEIDNINLETSELNIKKSNMDSDLDIIQSDKNTFKEQLNLLNDKVKNYFKCSFIDEIDIVISNAEVFLKNYNTLNQYYLAKIQVELEKINAMILIHENSLNEIKEEKEEVTRVM